MSQPSDDGRSTSPGRRAAIAGAAAAPALVLLAVVVGLVEGGLLPGACQGLACLFWGLVLGATGVVVVVWLVVWLGVRAARGRWPRTGWGLWAVRALAVASWVPVAWLVVLALE